MSEENKVLVCWKEIKELVESLELDVVKNSHGVAAAGIRARKGLRDLKSKAAHLVKMTVELDKLAKAESKKEPA